MEKEDNGNCELWMNHCYCNSLRILMEMIKFKQRQILNFYAWVLSNAAWKFTRNGIEMVLVSHLPAKLSHRESTWAWADHLIKDEEFIPGGGRGGGVAKYGCLPTSETMVFRTLNTKQLKPSTPRSWNSVFLLENWREEALSNREPLSSCKRWPGSLIKSRTQISLFFFLLDLFC